MLIQLFDSKPLCMIIARGMQAPDELIELANNSATPLFGSSQNSQLIVNHLQYFLSHKLAKRITIHGVFMDVMGIGVLLTGSSGIGKSELALELLSRGHRLIADDSPEFFLAEPEIISGGCPPALQDFLEVRGLGVLNIRTMFGDSAMRETKYLRLIIYLQYFSDDELQNIDRLRGSHQTKTILDVQIPQITIPVAPGRNMAVIVEVAIRNHILAMKGYNAAEDFILKQQQFIN
jgi:HPr kinase/phosphorylase